MDGAYELFSLADQAAPPGGRIWSCSARSAYMLGRDDDYVSGLERAHDAHLGAGEALARRALRLLAAT